MDFFKSLAIATAGLRAQAGRMRIIAENVANADSSPTRPNEKPYQRKVVAFERDLDRDIEADVVKLGRVRRDQSPYKNRYEPGHPAANEAGYVQMPNVDPLIETLDMREAQRSYEANLNVVTATRRMLARTLDILRV